jgi:hypothetical protein
MLKFVKKIKKFFEEIANFYFSGLSLDKNINTEFLKHKESIS